MTKTSIRRNILAMNRDIGILCRGSSVELSSKYFNNLKEIIAVNSFSKEVENQFISDIFTRSAVTHIMCREVGSIMHPSIYKKYNINKLILNVFEEEYNRGTVVRGLLERSGFSTSPLPSEMKPHQKEGGGFPTTGVLSVVYAAKVLKKEVIHIAGMDFYQKDYLINKKSKDYQKEKGKKMVEFIKNFAKINPSIKFIFYTYSDFSSDLSNVEIINE